MTNYKRLRTTAAGVPLPLLSLSVVSVALALVFAATPRVWADSLTVDFEPPAYTLGSVDHQPAANAAPNTWGGQYPPGISINTSLDQAVTGADAHGGVQSFRMSSFYTSGSFGDQVFSPSLANGAGEPAAISGGLSGGTLQPRFTGTVWFKSTTTTAQDSHVVISADRGDGARMSWIQVSDNVVDPPSTCSDNGNTCTSNADCTAGVADCLPDGRAGLSVSFYDYRVPASVLDCGGGQDTEGKCFVFAALANNLDRTTWHRIDFEMEFYAGEANDVVRVSVDGGTPFRGTSWEDYFRNNQNPPFTSPPTVDSLLFRAGGANEGSQGAGFYFDDLTFASTAASCPGARYVATSGDDTFNDCRDSGAPCATIQHAIDDACAGETINVAAGTYTENVVIGKPVTLAGAGQALSTIIPAVSNANPCTGSSLCGGAASNIILVQADNVTIQDLTLDGDNPNLTSNILRDSADLDARNGIITNYLAGDVHNLDVHNTTVQNVYLRGIYSTSAGNGNTFNFHDNTIHNVQGDYYSIAMFAYAASGVMASNMVSDAGDAISANHSLGIQFVNNTITNSLSGVHTDNSGDSGSNAPDLIQGNTVSDCPLGGYGVWVFVPYVAPTVRSNTVTNCDVGLAAAGHGGLTAVTTVFSDNVVDGANRSNSVGAYVTTSEFGFGSTDVSTIFTGNLIQNTTDGFQLQDKTCSATTTQGCKTDNDCPSGESCSLGYTLTVSATCNRIADNGTGVLTEALSTPALATFNSNVIAGNGTGIDGSALPAGPPLGAQNNYWGCASGPGTAGCDSVVGNVAALPAVASAPACAFCGVNSECNDGLACNGTESCNQGTSTCQATAPPDCSGPNFNDACHTGTCSEPNGDCTATAKPDGTSCSSGGATCQGGVCTGSTGSLIVASARLKKNTARNAKFSNGSVFVQAVVIDEDTGGTLPDDLTTGGPVTVDVQDGSGTFYSPQPVVSLTSCTKNSAGNRVSCKGDTGRKTTATFTKIRYFGHPYGEVWKMTLRRAGLAANSMATGTIHVTLHQGPVDRSDSPSDCSTAGNTRVCHHPSN